MDKMLERTKPPIEPRALRINDFCMVLGISRSGAYRMLARDEIKTIDIAGRRLVPMSEVDRLMAEALANAENKPQKQAVAA
jgi:predicted DNA-binding transcriptional regulator AlpA